MSESKNNLLSTLVVMHVLTLGILVVVLFNSPSASSTAVVGQGDSDNDPTAEYTSAYPVQAVSVTARAAGTARQGVRRP